MTHPSIAVRRRWLNHRRAWWLLACALLTICGCHRSLFRRAADAEANFLIRQKANDPRWPLEDYSVYPDPASRMFDPFDPDCPPLPPDDPTAHKLMHCVYCMDGYRCWHHQGDAMEVENPSWCSQLPWSEKGHITIDSPTAMELALLHSPLYQRALEELYLSALDVSFERFRFDTQFYAGATGFFTFDGRERSGTGESRSALDLATQGVRFQRLLATGGDLVVGLANQLMWEFSGPNMNSTSTLLDFSLVQPLMRGFGREIVLENLTQAERDLLANVRQMERFRRNFYLSVFAGRDVGLTPSRVVAGIPPGGFFSNNTSGLLGLLQTQQNIRNQRGNLAALESSVAQLEAFYLAGRIDYFQVELAQQAFYNAQSSLLNAELQYANALDQFKIQLGLPPSLDIELDEDMVKRFQLVDPAAVDLQNRMTSLQRSVGRTIVDLLDTFRPEEKITINPQAVNPLEPNPGSLEAEPDEPAPDATRDAAAPDTGNMQEPVPAESDVAASEDSSREQLSEQEVAELLQRLNGQVERALDIIERATGPDLKVVVEDIAELRSSQSARREAIERLKRQLVSEKHQWHVGRAMPDISAEDAEEMLPFDEQRLAALPQQLERTLNDVDLVFDQLTESLNEIKSLIEAAQAEPVDDELFRSLREKVFRRLPDELNTLAANVLSLTLVQARARTESATLVPVDVSWERAYSTAKEYRRDWMNARASLVDSWRQLKITADQLESRLDVVVEGDIGNLGDNPVRLRGENGRLRVGLEFDAPLSRLAERNAYRASLIEYQRARRQFYRFRDAVSSNLRAAIRTLDINQLNFEFRRAAVETAIAQVELARLRLREPPRPNQPVQLGATTARDLVSALSDLLNVQNDFLGVWVSHEALRRSLDFDMGTMELNADGTWLDPGKLTNEALPVSDDTNRQPCEQITSLQVDQARAADMEDEEEPYDAGIFAEGVDRLPSPNQADGEDKLQVVPPVLADEFVAPAEP
jgi:hypothetical protein